MRKAAGQMISSHKRIEQRIRTMPRGEAFVTSDFRDMADPETVSKALLRLADRGVIRRVLRGVYARASAGAEERMSPDAVARAIARANSWNIAPSGDTALYLVGLLPSKPGVWTYVTDGTYREYTLGNVTLRFLHTSGKLLSAVSEKTALMAQVLKAYGKDRLSDDLLRTLAAVFCHGDEELLLRESQRLSAWVFKAVRRMIAGARA